MSKFRRLKECWQQEPQANDLIELMVPGDGFEPLTRGFSIHGQQAKTIIYRILYNFVSKFCFLWTRGLCGDRGDRCLDVAALNGVCGGVSVIEARVRQMLLEQDFLKEADS